MGHFGGRTHWRTHCGRLRVEDDTTAAPRAAEKRGHDEIARLAYSYWEARGGREGSALEDWLRAERELSRRRELG